MWPLDLTPMSRMSASVSNSNLLPVMWFSLNRSAYGCMPHAPSPEKYEEACYVGGDSLKEFNFTWSEDTEGRKTNLLRISAASRNAAGMNIGTSYFSLGMALKCNLKDSSSKVLHTTFEACRSSTFDAFVWQQKTPILTTCSSVQA